MFHCASVIPGMSKKMASIFSFPCSMVFPLSSSLSSIKVVPGVFASKTKEHIIYIFWRRRRRRREAFKTLVEAMKIPVAIN
uniref:Uncharacterized protein n=1 Tax=Salix viminalis TaxID=40686 RepID=A0A6N2L197_SALVM